MKLVVFSVLLCVLVTTTPYATPQGFPTADTDGDGVDDAVDNCRTVFNSTQADYDDNGIGDACRMVPVDAAFYLSATEVTNAEYVVCTSGDNCEAIYNPDQWDSDADGVGDICALDDGLVLILFDDVDHMRVQQESGIYAWNIYAGDLHVLKSTGIYTQVPGSNASADRRCYVEATHVSDPGRPEAGKTIFALVAGIGWEGEGSLGQDSSGVERANTNPCP